MCERFCDAFFNLFLPQIRSQNLDTPTLRATCTERSGAFPSEDELRRLSQHRFLSTVYGVLDSVWHQLDALKEQFPKTKTLENARLNIQGIKNNVYCLARLLRPLLEIPEPTPADSGASQPTTNTPGAFQTRIENCRFLGGYHRFMGSVGRVFSEWGDGSKRSRRHSPLRARRPLQARRKGARRIRPSRSSQSRMPRAQGPR